MSDLYSICCGAPPNEYFGVCSKCLDHTGFENLCTKCDDPCLIDGELINSIPVVYAHDEVAHVECPV